MVNNSTINLASKKEDTENHYPLVVFVNNKNFAKLEYPIRIVDIIQRSLMHIYPNIIIRLL